MRAFCRDRLVGNGFDVADERFEYSVLPGLWATPVAGAIACLTIIVAAALGRSGRPAAALALSIGIVLLLGVVGRMLVGRVTTLPVLRAASVNLVATRGTPRIWLVAHLDSKSQPVPMLVRIAAIILTGAAICVLALLALLALLAVSGGAVGERAWSLTAIGGALASLPVIASVVGARSPGALDNASGIVTVLLAVDALPRAMSVGVLFTSAEELGLAGANAFAATRAPAMAINVDGVDDHGTTVAMHHGRAARVRVGVARAARAFGMSIHERSTIPGLLTDGVALGRAGWSVVTLSRGGIGTLGRIHRPSDVAARLRGIGMHDVARLVARAACEIA